uniref:Uncharacterized protein n=1 Tax=Parastrongyloides trichosuri TaxID=131310 RepID=A0A0N4Z4F5_PARTI
MSNSINTDHQNGRPNNEDNNVKRNQENSDNGQENIINNGDSQVNRRHVIYQDNIQNNPIEFNNNEIHGDLETSIDLTEYTKCALDGIDVYTFDEETPSTDSNFVITRSTGNEAAPSSSEGDGHENGDIVHIEESFDQISAVQLEPSVKSNSSSSLVEINEERISIRSKSSDDNDMEHIEKITTYAIIETKKEIKKDEISSPQNDNNNRRVSNNDIVIVDKLSQIEDNEESDNESTTLLENTQKMEITKNINDQVNTKNAHENEKALSFIAKTLLYLPKLDIRRKDGEGKKSDTATNDSPNDCENTGKCPCCTIL